MRIHLGGVGHALVWPTSESIDVGDPSLRLKNGSGQDDAPCSSNLFIKVPDPAFSTFAGKPVGAVND
jgi:hypothetical protein